MVFEVHNLPKLTVISKSFSNYGCNFLSNIKIKYNSKSIYFYYKWKKEYTRKYQTNFSMREKLNLYIYIGFGLVIYRAENLTRCHVFLVF